MCRLCWYVGEKYLRDLRNREEFPRRVLEGVEILANFLVTQVRVMERGTDQTKKDAKEEVPADRVKDPAAVARELRWRVEQAAGNYSDDEDPEFSTAKDRRHALNGLRGKRKRDRSAEVEQEATLGNKKNFKPKLWTTVIVQPVEEGKHSLRVRKPENPDDWQSSCTSWADEIQEVAGAEEVDITRRRDVVVKVRRTVNGVEKQRVETCYRRVGMGQ
jgi:F-box/leucine-rich repeat protein 10/11